MPNDTTLFRLDPEMLTDLAQISVILDRRASGAVEDDWRQDCWDALRFAIRYTATKLLEEETGEALPEVDDALDLDAAPARQWPGRQHPRRPHRTQRSNANHGRRRRYGALH